LRLHGQAIPDPLGGGDEVLTATDQVVEADVCGRHVEGANVGVARLVRLSRIEATDGDAQQGVAQRPGAAVERRHRGRTAVDGQGDVRRGAAGVRRVAAEPLGEGGAPAADSGGQDHDDQRLPEALRENEPRMMHENLLPPGGGLSRREARRLLVRFR
jgi:hypothetical protein